MNVLNGKITMQLPINYDEAHWTVRKNARNQYIKEQNNKCWCCGEPLDSVPSKKILSKPINIKLFPKGMFDYPIHLHHDRKTGLTIGAVHSRCNAYLWQYKGE